MLNRIYMAASVLIRMGLSMVVFILLARGLGPTTYGFIATVYAYASIAALVTDFGFSNKTLRDISAYPDRGGEILNASLTVKGILTLGVSIVGGGAILLLPSPPDIKLASGMLAGGIVFGAFGDLALITFRAVGKYSGEMWITGWTSVVHVAILAPIALMHANVVIIGGFFLVSRLFYAAVSTVGAERLFTGHRVAITSVRESLLAMRKAWSWAADSGLSFLNGQMDAILMAQNLPLAAVGIYQSAGRIVQNLQSLSTIIGGVALPKVAARAAAGDRRISAIRGTMTEYLGCGLVVAVGLVFCGPIFQKIALGPKYVQVNQLWLGFAVFLFLRFAAGGFGVVLAGYGEAVLRVGGQATAAVMILLSTPILLKSYGIIAMPWVMAASAAITFVMYGAAVAYILVLKPAAK